MQAGENSSLKDFVRNSKIFATLKVDYCSGLKYSCLNYFFCPKKIDSYSLRAGSVVQKDSLCSLPAVLVSLKTILVFCFASFLVILLLYFSYSLKFLGEVRLASLRNYYLDLEGFQEVKLLELGQDFRRIIDCGWIHVGSLGYRH